MEISCLEWVLNFYLALCNVYSFVPFAKLNDECAGTRHVDSNPTWLPIPGGLGGDYQGLSVLAVRELRFFRRRGGSPLGQEVDFGC